jgi:hypothetical protein
MKTRELFEEYSMLLTLIDKLIKKDVPVRLDLTVGDPGGKVTYYIGTVQRIGQRGTVYAWDFEHDMEERISLGWAQADDDFTLVKRDGGYTVINVKK